MNKTFRLPIYPCALVISTGASNKKLKKFLKKKKIKFGKYFKGETSEGRATTLNNGWIIIRFLKKHPTHETVSHEIFHVVNHVMNYIEMPFDNANDEAFAYLTGYITELVYKNFKIK